MIVTNSFCGRDSVLWTRAVAIHDSLNRESIQNPNFQVNRESMIRQNERILLLKESIHESRTDSKSRFSGESWINDSQILLNHDGPSFDMCPARAWARVRCLPCWYGQLISWRMSLNGKFCDSIQIYLQCFENQLILWHFKLTIFFAD